MKKGWTFNPHVGGRTIPPAVKARTGGRIVAHAEKNFKGQYIRVDVRFRGALCYIDVYEEHEVWLGSGPKTSSASRDQHLQRLRNTPPISAGSATSATRTAGR